MAHYSIGMHERERERERGGGGFYKSWRLDSREDDERKGKNREKDNERGCGCMWDLVHLPLFFLLFFFFPNLVVQVQAIRRLIHLFVVIISPLRFANYLLPTTTQSLSLSLSISIDIYIYIYIYIYLIMKSKWTGRVKDHG